MYEHTHVKKKTKIKKCHLSMNKYIHIYYLKI